MSASSPCCLKHANIVPIHVLGQQVRTFPRSGARRVVAKLGPGGARLVTREPEVLWPVIPDSTAAGDVWNGAFATALAEGQPEDEAGLFAAIGSLGAAAPRSSRMKADRALPTIPGSMNRC
jgi:ribokinase